jgi:hypothetical protein
MMQAVDQCLTAVGLDLEKGYQTCIVQHTDEPQVHLHIVVNLVHPVTGKQINPHRDLPKAQGWARQYDKQRGNNFCPEREKKHAERDRWIANGRPPRAERAFDWAARGAAVKSGIDRLKFETAARYGALRASEQAAYAARRAEAAQFRKERQAGRAAILQNYAVRLDGVWNPTPAPAMPPDRSAEARLASRLTRREENFKAREESLIGRMRNARSLAGKEAGIGRIMRLALNANERRSLFDRQQRILVARERPPEQAAPRIPQPVTPSPKSYRSAQLKKARAAELSKYDTETGELRVAMVARHTADRKAATATRERTRAEIAASWKAFRAEYQLQAQPTKAFNRAADPQTRPGRGRTPLQETDTPRLVPQAGQAAAKTPATEQDTQARPSSEGEARDRFGRSRNRKPRDPARRQRRSATAAKPEGAAESLTESFPSPQPVESPDVAQEWRAANDPGAVPGEGDTMTAEEKRAAGIRAIKEAWDAEAERNRAADVSDDSSRTHEP